MTDHLLREFAPISATAWKQIDEEAKERLTPRLAARRLVDFSGPHGWTHSATNLGRTAQAELSVKEIDAGAVCARLRRVLPLGEFRVAFTVRRSELEDAARGAVDVDYDDLDRAAHDVAVTENTMVFHGWAGGGVTGIVDASTHETIPLSADPEQYPHAIARATDTLRSAGVEGPYAMAIGPAGYRRIVETTEHGGYLLTQHLKRILGGELVWTPGLEGAVVLSQRGGDFMLDVGQDLSVGYRSHDTETLSLFLEESASFRVTEPDAAIALTE
jgi:uncharacterized linocin/CFP29 family protein